MSKQLRKDQFGGAVVELAICSLVVVPLVFYGSWFADVAHWKMKLEEASIGATMDLTAYRVHDYSSSAPDFHKLYSKAITGSVGGGSAVPVRMKSSFDSSNPSAHPMKDAMFVIPSKLNVTCREHLGGDPGDVHSFKMNEGRPGEHIRELNTHTWVTCRSSARLTTAGIPKKYQELDSVPWLFQNSWTHLKMCGVGPGVQGCGSGGDDGLTVMLDDWALSNYSESEGQDIPLSMVPYDVTPSASNTEHSLWAGTRHNSHYFKMAKLFWRSPRDYGSGDVMKASMAVAGADEMGLTDDFHMSFRYAKGHAFHEQERKDGQVGAYGGPDGQQRDDPHTGGPWHERYAVGANGDADNGTSADHYKEYSSYGRYLGMKNFGDSSTEIPDP